MHKLHFHQITETDQLAEPTGLETCTLKTPALHFFTDFNEVKPLVIEANVSALEVKNMMTKSHIKMKFVIDKQNRFIGLVSLKELSDLEIVKKTSEGFNREEILVTDMMVRKSQLKAFDYHEIEHATIGEVIEALKDNGQHHCLVLERDSHKIRGIFSASDLSRKLNLSIDIHNMTSFYKIFAALPA